MVHFPPLPSPAYVFSGRYFGMSQSGFPHSEIPGSKPACGSPRLIAACHVLHRLLAPRHSPYALSSLTKCSLHLTFLLHQPEGWIGHEYVVKKLPIAEYSVVKKPCLTLMPLIASRHHPDCARGAVKKSLLVENTGIEPVTSWLQTRRSPS
jgi:hypothetical protein